MCSLTGAYSAYLKWSPPQQPNGVISRHRLVYRKHQKDPTLNSTAVAALTVEVKSQENIYHYHYTQGWFSFGVGVVFLSLKALHTCKNTHTLYSHRCTNMDSMLTLSLCIVLIIFAFLFEVVHTKLLWDTHQHPVHIPLSQLSLLEKPNHDQTR